MTRTENFITIYADLEKVYRLAQEVEKYPEFIPGYKESKIVGQEKGKIIIERAALINKKLNRWKSKAWFNLNRSIEFEQIEGRLKGMKVEWLFERIPGGTKLTIIHTFKIKVPPIGWFIEKVIARPRIEQITENVLTAFKNRIEGNKRDNR